jgi:hypothetical protein
VLDYEPVKKQKLYFLSQKHELLFQIWLYGVRSHPFCFEGKDHSGGRGQHSRIIERKYYSFYRKTGKSTKILLKLSLITDCCSLYYFVRSLKNMVIFYSVPVDERFFFIFII